MFDTKHDVRFTASRVDGVPESKLHRRAKGRPTGWGSVYGAAWREAEKLKPGECVRLEYGNKRVSKTALQVMRSFAYTAAVADGAIYKANHRGESVYITRLA